MLLAVPEADLLGFRVDYAVCASHFGALTILWALAAPERALSHDALRRTDADGHTTTSACLNQRCPPPRSATVDYCSCSCSFSCSCSCAEAAATHPLIL